MAGKPPERPLSAGSSAARRDPVIAHGLRRIYRTLRPDTITAYLLTPGERSLAAAMALDTPLAFTLTPVLPVEDPRYGNAAAFTTGRIVLSPYADIRRLIMAEPALVPFVPAPTMAASVPVGTPRRRFGALTLRWVRHRDLSAEEQEFLMQAATAIAERLERLAAEGEPMTAPPIPVFIPAVLAPPGSPGSGGPDDESAAAGSPVIGSTTFLYQFQRLAIELTAAVSPLDVIATVRRHIVEPFGGSAVMLCLTEEGRLRTAASAGFNRDARHAVDGLLLASGVPETDAVMGVQPLLFESLAELRAAYPLVDRYEEGEGTWFLPLIANGRSTGCCVVMCNQRRRPTDEELAVMMIMLGQVAQSLRRARFHEFEHDMAQSMQRSLLPGSLPHMEGVVATGRYLSADEDAEVGGDWYDVIKLPDGRVGLLIGDVEGHSLEAAAVMGQLRSGVRAYAGEGHDPSVVLARAGELLSGLDTDLFATCCCVWLDTETGSAAIASAGHPTPVLIDAEGRATVPPVPVGPPLSVEVNAAYDTHRTTLRPGTVVALYTDGLVEARGSDNGSARLVKILAEEHGADLEVLADRIVAGSGVHRSDDLALLLVRFEGLENERRGRVARISIQRDDLQQVRRLRHYLRGSLQEWELDPLIDELELLISEVVTNALVHAGSAVDVRLRRYADRVRVDVRDSDPHPPIIVAVVDAERPVESEAESGRGMLIVDAVASAWGSSPSGRGKTTWFELSTRSDSVRAAG